MTLDPRLHPYRRDLAARHLEGTVKSDRFVDGRRMQVGTSVVPVTGTPDPEGSLTSQMMLGEIFTVYDVDDATGLAWGQAERDGYVGWTPRFALEKPEEATHRVKANFTHVYPEPELKCRAFDALPFLAEVAVTGQEGKWLELASGGFVYGRHLEPDLDEPDWVGTAERFLGVPYLWGGKSSLGLDCSALVQTALHAARKRCPRDSDMQEAELGVEVNQTSPRERGDLIFWKGHVGIMLDDVRMLHANAFAMAVTIERLDLARDRIMAQDGGPITSIKRL
ncbi:C40 family peptidase [Pontivivens insulae]|uniref:Gamma-D-glutamyl-L-lysine endopeptidase n=1 Tax=Pontivivens insulae TaxID=1639689 RepID=A0A2R8AFF2_9RHOB|nr:NlpC/P60 family protein [Pontivivens insulae]RED12215.1 NlpC/P60 family protein [Pontivivens insulae]SPF30971.1 Gamma-D-glutamyl-L-lysine endopeptidase [Pontivivens insulae]